MGSTYQLGSLEAENLNLQCQGNELNRYSPCLTGGWIQFLECCVLFRTPEDGQVQKPNNSNCNIPSREPFRMEKKHCVGTSVEEVTIAYMQRKPNRLIILPTFFPAVFLTLTYYGIKSR
jgi:hypothetical protein